MLLILSIFFSGYMQKFMLLSLEIYANWSRFCRINTNFLITSHCACSSGGGNLNLKDLEENERKKNFMVILCASSPSRAWKKSFMFFFEGLNHTECGMPICLSVFLWIWLVENFECKVDFTMMLFNFSKSRLSHYFFA